MGIFYEEVMYKPQNNYTGIITESDIREIVNENEELFCEMMDMQIDQINMIISESVFEDWGIKKEDLLNPEKLRGILRRIDKETDRPGFKEVLITTIAIFLYSFLGALPGYLLATIALATTGPGALVAIGNCANIIGSILFPCLKLTNKGRKKTLLKKLDKAESKINKYLKNPEKYKLGDKEIKEYKKQLDIIHDNQSKIRESIKHPGRDRGEIA